MKSFLRIHAYTLSPDILMARPWKAIFPSIRYFANLEEI